jgi:hypothetical protein
MDISALDKLIKNVCDEYVQRWKTEGKKYISISSFEQMYAEGNITPIEEESLLTVKLYFSSKTDPHIPSSIPELPLQILRRLPIYLTRTLEIQVNQDHYEYWAWSAEVFTSLEDNISLLKDLKDVKHNVIDLLFHTCLAKTGYPPATPEARTLNVVIQAVTDRHVQHMVINKFILGAALASIALESIIRNMILISNFEKAKKELGENPTLGRVLGVFKEYVLPSLPQEFQNDISELNRTIESIWGVDGSTWDKIIRIKWRNYLIHGKGSWIPRAFGVMTNYMCLLLWHNVPSEIYETKAREVLNRIKWLHEVGDALRNYWSFYPP